MSRRHSTLVTVFLAALAVGATAAGQQPRVTNGRVTTQAAGSPLAQSFRTLVGAQSEVAWIGYSVPRRRRARDVLLRRQRHASCTAHESAGAPAAAPAASSRRRPPATVRQPCRPRPGRSSSKGRSTMMVLFRIENKAVERIRVLLRGLRARCRRQPFVWLEGVRPADSVALLESLRNRRRGTGRTRHRRRCHRDRAARRSRRGRGARAAGRPDAARSGASEGDVLARQLARRARARGAAARASRRSEHRGAQERRLRRLAEPRSRCLRRAVRTGANRSRAAHPERSGVLALAEG